MNRKSPNRARWSCAAALVLVAWIAGPAVAADDKGPAGTAVAQALAEARAEAARELTQKDIQNLSARLDAQDKRLRTYP